MSNSERSSGPAGFVAGPRGPWGPWRHARQTRWPDVGLALKVGIPQVIGTFFAAHNQPDRRSLDILGVLLLLAGPALLAVRRRSQVGVLVGVMAVTVVYYALNYPLGPVFIALLVALFTTVTAGHRRAALIVAGTGYTAFVVADRWIDRLSGEHSLVGYVGAAAWLLVVLAVAEVVRSSRERARETAHALEEEDRRRASEERMRIAHDLHDVVAHNISLINVQAGVALHLMDEQPEQARTALTAIKDASRDALRELRATLDILRGADGGAPRSPTPGISDLPNLVQSARTGGLDARLETLGAERLLPAAVELAAYRVVQEALTNVRRHGGAAAATVWIEYGPEVLSIRVDDDGRGVASGSPARGTRTDGPPPSSGSNKEGFGIRGMRERVSELGGELTAGPRPGGGFRVTARIPTDRPPRAASAADKATGEPPTEPGPAREEGDTT